MFIQTLLLYFYVEKFVTSPDDQGRSPAGYMTKNVSFVLVWTVALSIVFARARLNRNFFKAEKWYNTYMRIMIFAVIPAAWFLSQFFRMVGVVYQSYFYQSASLDVCAYKCYIPHDELHDELPDCCKTWSECDSLGGYQNASYYVQGNKMV